MWVNGVNAGSVACGDNASTNSKWDWAVIGQIMDSGNTNYTFRGSIASVRVSNVALYSGSFTTLSTLNRRSSTVFLLIDNF
jgi:hypothetical protein